MRLSASSHCQSTAGTGHSVLWSQSLSCSLLSLHCLAFCEQASRLRSFLVLKSLLPDDSSMVET